MAPNNFTARTNSTDRTTSTSGTDLSALPASLGRPPVQRHRIALRKPLVGVLAIAALGLSLLAPGQAGADPDTIASVNAELTKLSIANEQLTEQFNAATIDVDAKTAAAASAGTAADAAQVTYTAARDHFKTSLVEQYTGSSFSRTAALLNSASGQEYLDQLETLNLMNVKRSGELTALTAAKDSAQTAQATAADLLNQATSLRDSLAQQQEDLAADQKTYKTKLASLTAAQQAAYYAARSTATTPTGQTVAAPATAAPVSMAAPAPSQAAAVAVQTALAQQGKPYVYAAGGPGTYDCSGLTQYAWAAAGVYLPHNAAAQYGYGTHVSLDALQPGDLVFYYSPIAHVGVYIGNGQIVHAPTSGDVVRVVSVYASGTPVGATRL
ncbi:MAG: Cell wall-associated hydrolase, invasion-associated protein [Pseudonocardiales bacterium]|nr:Cell wall-associated hydrolase, invasion-associated protein [Pseudonocardiales bacterium]